MVFDRKEPADEWEPGTGWGGPEMWQKNELAEIWFPSGLRWVWMNFRMAVIASPASPYNPRWFGRALGRRNSPRAIARHTQPPEPVVMGDQPRWGEPLETVISAAEFTIPADPVSVPSQTGTPSRVDPHYRLSDRPFHDPSIASRARLLPATRNQIKNRLLSTSGLARVFNKLTSQNASLNRKNKVANFQLLISAPCGEDWAPIRFPMQTASSVQKVLSKNCP